MNKPVPMSRAQLLEVLEDVTTRVREGDSYEGSLSFWLEEDEEFTVVGVYRIGNLDGQGGMRIIGVE